MTLHFSELMMDVESRWKASSGGIDVIEPYGH